MDLIGKRKLIKLKNKKNDNLLSSEIDKLINDIEANNWSTPKELKKVRSDADCVHSNGFYFFNIKVHRTMIMIGFEAQEAEVIWVGSHDEYINTFKNNKNTIKKWLNSKDLI